MKQVEKSAEELLNNIWRGNLPDNSELISNIAAQLVHFDNVNFEISFVDGWWAILTDKNWISNLQNFEILKPSYQINDVLVEAKIYALSSDVIFLEAGCARIPIRSSGALPPTERLGSGDWRYALIFRRKD